MELAVQTVEVSNDQQLQVCRYRCAYDDDWTMVSLSENAEEILGYSVAELIGNAQLSYNDLIHPDDRAYVKEVVAFAIEQRRPFSIKYRIYTRDRRLKWMWEHGVAVCDTAGNVLHIDGLIAENQEALAELTDLPGGVAQELALQRSLLSQYKEAVDSSAIVSKADPYGVITYVNDEFCRVSGYDREELVGATHAQVRHEDTPASMFRDMWGTILKRGTWRGVIKNRRKDGRAYYVDSVITPITGPQGEIVEFISIRHDVTDLIEQEKQIERQNTDLLTGLPNRIKLLQDLNATPEGALLLININDFSLINEYYGYQSGDEVLDALARRLSELLLPGMTLYSLAADEFAIRGPAFDDLQAFADYCDELAYKVSIAPLDVKGEDFVLSISIGGGLGRNAYIEADIALHDARRRRLSCAIYGQGSALKQRIEDNINWVNRIRSAIRDDRIEPYAQPIYCARSGEVKKYECLMRLRDETGKVHSPFAFLEIAKRARLYDQLMYRMIDKTFRFFAPRQEAFALNLTARDILSEGTADLILSGAVQFGVAQRLTLEIVESEGIENFEQVSQFIDRAHAIGCQIAVDDFGSGYSNFEYLLRLKVNAIKVDGSLIRNLDTDSDALMMAETIVNFGKRLKAETVAEYVHSEAVREVAVGIGFDALQGFLLGEPVPLAEIDNKA